MKKPTVIVRNSLHNQALGVLKARILSGDIPPGTQLIVDTLAGDLKISRTPVREALITLIKLDAAFHKLIYEGSQNRRLKNILTDIQDKLGLIYRWGNLTKKLEYAETATIDEYLNFVGCFKRRDVRKAMRLIDKHPVDGEQFVLWCLGFSPEANGPVGSAANKD